MLRFCSMNTRIMLEPKQVQLLDEALRIAYTQLVTTGAARGHQFQELRDPLVVPMVGAILKGETDSWRIARLGLFCACEILAFGNLNRTARASDVAA